MSPTLLKMIYAAFLGLVPIFTFILCRILRLNKLKIIFTDLALPLYVFMMVYSSSVFFEHSFFFHYLSIMSVLAMFVAVWIYKRQGVFHYSRWFKVFWRMGFFVSFFFYLAVLIILFKQP